jgi:putative ABC transport system permease protein
MNPISLIVRRSLRQHALATGVTVFSVALASGLLMAVFAIKAQTHEAFTAGQTGYDAVLGARGSQLQLVLNTVFHLETSPGNIPWKLYQDIKSDPRVKLAVPYAVGDNYQGFRIVGTTLDAFTAPVGREKGFRVEQGGRLFDPAAKEAVIGSFAAQKTGLKVGSTFNPYHGVFYDPKMRHADVYTVTGVLAPTNTPCDRVVWIPIDGIYRMSGHVLRGTGKDFVAGSEGVIPDASKEVSGVMIRLRAPQAGFILDQTINKQGKVATFAWPIGRVMAELFDKVGWMDKVLALIAALVALVSGAAILASIYNTINERRREFAILRALGARKATVFAAIVLEASAIAALGTLLGFFFYAGVVSVAAWVIRAQTGVVLDVARWNVVFAWTPVAMTALGALAGVVPAFKAYATDVAANLAPTS